MIHRLRKGIESNDTEFNYVFKRNVIVTVMPINLQTTLVTVTLLDEGQALVHSTVSSTAWCLTVFARVLAV